MSNTCKGTTVNVTRRDLAQSLGLTEHQVIWYCRNGAPQDIAGFSNWLAQRKNSKPSVKRRLAAQALAPCLGLSEQCTGRYLRLGMPTDATAHAWLSKHKAECSSRMSAAQKCKPSSTKGHKLSWTHEAARLSGLTVSGVQSLSKYAPHSPVCFWVWYRHFKIGEAARRKLKARKLTPEQATISREKRLLRARERERLRRQAGLIQQRDRAKRREWERNRRATDPKFRLKKCLRARISKALKLFKTKKKDRTVDLIGCSVGRFMEHIQGQFKPGMAWNNQGKIWHIDHIIPVSKFDLTRPEEQRAAFHWSNCQPLWAPDNIRKSNKLFYYVKRQGEIAL